jgi:putative Mg2+ transporter-C (MgtC) family protein
VEWLLGDWRLLLPWPWANVALALVAVLCGAIVGMERERKEKPAGMRTLSLVCLGATVFTMASYLFAPDHARVAAQVVTGIGFLGAGVILRGSGGVSGTVTAASIWVIAAAGMVAGTGHGGAAIALSLLVLVVLMVISQVERHLVDICGVSAVRVLFDPAGGKTLLKIEELLDVHEVHTEPTEVRSISEGLMEARLTYCREQRHHREFLGRLAEMPEVKEIRREG